ncbi:MAG: SET domain-containing protein-lysine N-methyltransferase [Thermoplasmata archaeon]
MVDTTVRADFSVAASKIHGRGVLTKKAFLQDDLVLEIDDSDPVLDRGKLTPEEEIFIDVFVAVDGTLKTTWMKSPEKFINHSCEPNSYVRTDMRTGVRRTWALKDLQAGDELTWDYALNIWEEWVGPVPCHCGAKNCRRIIRGNYFTLPREVQRRYLPFLDEPFQRRFTEKIRSLNLAAERDSA